MRNENCKNCNLDNVVPRTEKNMLCNLSGFQSHKPGFLRVAGKAKTEESEIMSEARDKKMKLKRRLDEEKAIRVMRACRFRRYDENR